jgi:NADPH:quinone reductase
MSDKKSIPAIMKAVFLEKEGGPLIVREVPVPVPGVGDVLVKIIAAPVNPSDLARIRLVHSKNDIELFIPGIEGSGTVVAAGKGILPKLWLGKRVACSAHYPTSGTWAEYIVTKAGSCFPLNSGVSDEQGSMSLVNPLTALGFFEIAREQGKKAIINNAAASALGRMVELLGKKERIQVINIVRSQKQVDNLKKLGSEYVLDSSEPLFIEKLGELSKELNVTLLFDSVCSPQLEKMIEVLPHGSSVVIYGNLTNSDHILVNPRTLITNDITITGFYLANRAKQNGLYKNMMNLRKVGTLMSTEMKIKIRDRFPLEKAQVAVDTYLTDMSVGKVLLMPNYNQV